MPSIRLLGFGRASAFNWVRMAFFFLDDRESPSTLTVAPKYKASFSGIRLVVLHEFANTNTISKKYKINLRIIVLHLV
jgi:hypothetical protein